MMKMFQINTDFDQQDFVISEWPSISKDQEHIHEMQWAEKIKQISLLSLKNYSSLKKAECSESNKAKKKKKT